MEALKAELAVTKEAAFNEHAAAKDENSKEHVALSAEPGWSGWSGWARRRGWRDIVRSASRENVSASTANSASTTSREVVSTRTPHVQPVIVC